MAHADLTAAAFTLWGIRLSVERRVWTSQLAFSLAVLAKETAVITPLAIALWELLVPLRAPLRNKLSRMWPWLTPLLPLAVWLTYHHHETGRFLATSEFYQYNVAQTLNPLLIDIQPTTHNISCSLQRYPF